jgi:hypothetical protein
VRWLGDPTLPQPAAKPPHGRAPSPMACGGGCGGPEAGPGSLPSAASCHRSSPSSTFSPSSWWPTGSTLARRSMAWICKHVAGVNGCAQIDNRIRGREARWPVQQPIGLRDQRRGVLQRLQPDAEGYGPLWRRVGRGGHIADEQEGRRWRDRVGQSMEFKCEQRVRSLLGHAPVPGHKIQWTPSQSRRYGFSSVARRQ